MMFPLSLLFPRLSHPNSLQCCVCSCPDPNQGLGGHYVPLTRPFTTWSCNQTLPIPAAPKRSPVSPSPANSHTAVQVPALETPEPVSPCCSRSLRVQSLEQLHGAEFRALYYRSLTEFPGSVNIRVPLTPERALKACFLQRISKRGATGDLLRSAASLMSPRAEGTETGSSPGTSFNKQQF